MQKRVYLAGPIRGCSYDNATDWREYAIKELAKDGIIGVSPMRAKEFLRGIERLELDMRLRNDFEKW